MVENPGNTITVGIHGGAGSKYSIRYPTTTATEDSEEDAFNRSASNRGATKMCHAIAMAIPTSKPTTPAANAALRR